MWLVAGLGNPGQRYARTRHNIGFRVVDRLAEEAGATFTGARTQGLEARIRVGQQHVLLFKPLTYMNESGQAVRAALTYRKIDIERLLIVSDDVSLPLGKIRFRRRGSSGGQKGIQHIITLLRSEDFCRLRIGIDDGKRRSSLSRFVLADFPARQRDLVEEVVDTAAVGVKDWIAEGIDSVMNRYNHQVIG